MRFIYPAIVCEKSDGSFHARFPDLAMCEAEGSSVDDVLRNAVGAARDWIELEFQEDEPDLPPASDPSEIVLKEGEFVLQILVIYRMHEGWDE